MLAWLAFVFYSVLTWKWIFEFACLQEASREAAPPTDKPSSGQRPGSSCNSLAGNYERNSLQHTKMLMPMDFLWFSRALGCAGIQDLKALRQKESAWICRSKVRVEGKSKLLCLFGTKKLQAPLAEAKCDSQSVWGCALLTQSHYRRHIATCMLYLLCTMPVFIGSVFSGSFSNTCGKTSHLWHKPWITWGLPARRRPGRPWQDSTCRVETVEIARSQVCFSFLRRLAV